MILHYIPELSPLPWPRWYFDIISKHKMPCILLNFCNYCWSENQVSTIESLLVETYSNFQNPPLLIIYSLGEAPTIDNFKFLKSLPSGLKILHITSAWESPQAEYTTITDCNRYWLRTNELSYNATHHFVALARTPRSGRTRVINSIINKNLHHCGYFSIGCHSYQVLDQDRHPSPDWYWQFSHELGIDQANLKYFPSVIDGYIPSLMGPKVSNNDKIKNALVNVILETSFDYSTSAPFDRPWTVPFLTEKTAKAVAYGQIPLILGPPGQVEKTKQLGFDLFDDYIDYSYANELAPLARIEKFVKSLEQFINHNPQANLQSLKESLMPRFLYNIELAKKLSYCNESDAVTEFLDLALLEQY